MSELGQIIILNGAPRAGKSSIATAIQETCAGLWINLGVDHSMRTTPARVQPGIGLRPGGERPDLEPIVVQLYAALYASIAAHSRLGINVVVDVRHHDAYSRPLGILPACAQRLHALPVLFVGVRCPLEVIMQRRVATGYNSGAAEAPPPVLRWQDAVHDPGVYDLEVDTSVLSAQGCAEQIRHRLAGSPPTAFKQIAAMGETHMQAARKASPG
jgi:chloramphenicol 3-O phosphotransferase